MNKMLLDLPARLETARLTLRPYGAGDGPMYWAAAQRNRDHLARYESGNILMGLTSAEDAEVAVRTMAADWAQRNCFFWGIFERESGAWVGQVYVGVLSWDLPEFEIGYVADAGHEGRGYVSEAVRAVLRWVFAHLRAERVRLACDATNVRSARVAERCGFTLEGRLRRSHRNPDGTLGDTLLYGLLRGERKEHG